MMVTPVVVGLMWSYILDSTLWHCELHLERIDALSYCDPISLWKPWVAVLAVKAWKTTRSTNHTFNGNLHILSAPCSRAHLLAYFPAHL